ncbi:MAG: hypothetical protein ACI9O6_001466 [Glaciecola sp.]
MKDISVKWRIILSLILTKLTDILLSAKTTLPTLLNAVGAPSWMLGLLVPLRESGSLLPQALMGAWLKNKSDRQKPWLFSMVLQSLFIAMMFLLPLLLFPYMWNIESVSCAAISGFIILASLSGLSLSRAMTSLTMKDIQGEHLRKGMRGNVVGIASTAAGVLSLVFATFSFFSSTMNEQILLVIAGGCLFAMCLSILILKNIETKVDADNDSDENTTSIKDKVRSYIETFSGDLAYFILVRSCFVHTALIAPFFIVWSLNAYPQNTLVSLSSFIIAQGSATIVSSYIWGKLSDYDARLTMQLGALIVFIICVLLLIVIHFDFAQSLPPISFILCYFVLSVGHEGARSGRKVYALDIKVGAQRTDFIGKANTSIGIVILLLGVFYSAISFAGNFVLFSLMAVGLAFGLIISFKMKKEKS